MSIAFPVVNPSALGVWVIGQDLDEFHISINVPKSTEIHFQKLEEVLSSCKSSSVKKCFFHIIQKPCSTFIGKALLFYEDFCQNSGHEVFIIYYDEETKRLLNILRLGAIFNIFSKEYFEQESAI